MERFRDSLKRGESVTSATYEAGFGSSSRLYERVNSARGMTPSTFRSGGTGVTLRYVTVPTVVGRMLIAQTERGIAAVSFGDSEALLVASLKEAYPNAILRRDSRGMRQQIRGMLQCLDGQVDAGRLGLDVKATVFQRKVWEALQQIPRGSTRSYREIARAIGQPAAARAVARACATNSVAVAIPCHRVLRGNGSLAGYRWGLQRKKQLLALLIRGIAHEVPRVHDRWLRDGPARLWTLVAGLVEAGKRSGEFRPDADSEVAARVLVSGLVLQRLWNEDAENIPEIAVDQQRLIDSSIELFLASLRRRP